MPLTLGSAVARSADVVSSVPYTRVKDVAKINNIPNEDWYNTKEGSIYVDFDPSTGSGSDAVVLGVGDGTSRGFRAPWLAGATQIRAASWSGTAYSALQYYNSIILEIISISLFFILSLKNIILTISIYSLLSY